MPDIYEIKSGLMGFIVGDAMGVPTEFCDRKILHENPVTDMVGYGTHEMPPGSWSDDSSMILATMDSIISKECIDLNDMMERFINWTKGDYTPAGYMFDIGKTTKDSIMRYSRDNNPTGSGGKSLYDNGNGSLMRILPVVYYCCYKQLSEDDLRDTVTKVSSLTHAHEISILGCYLYAKYIIALLNGTDKTIAYKNLSTLSLTGFSEDSIKAYKRILDENIGTLHLNDIKSTGYVVDTLEAAIWCILNHQNYKNTIIEAINLGCDTDTIAAIAGGAAGTIYGLDSIPIEWRRCLQNKESVESLIERFLSYLIK